ncbi:hypothetical protein [Aeromonas enteropelogenes]|uniref:hypothetical protein n=1 Tax=Aeromonas enteropelogenes TaxID=29489 RepID=UPI003B9EDA2B
MREQNSSVFSDPNGAILKELYELKQLVIQQGQAQKEVLSAEECAELLGVSGFDPIDPDTFSRLGL